MYNELPPSAVLCCRVQLLYNVVLVSAIEQIESAICVHISPLWGISFPLGSPYSTEQSSLCFAVDSHQPSIVCMVVCICQSQSLDSCYTISFFGVHTFVLYICIPISALQMGSLVPSFSIPHISINIQLPLVFNHFIVLKYEQHNLKYDYCCRCHFSAIKLLQVFPAEFLC